MQGGELELDRILYTVKTLSSRIQERFPDANLTTACNRLLGIGIQTKERIAWIERPMLLLRFGVGSFLVALVAACVWGYRHLKPPDEILDLAEFVSLLEASLSGAVVIGAVGYFLFTLETRIRRTRTLKALHELRAMAHIIDMHQLTKDPDRLIFGGVSTQSSPERVMTVFEMGRYLDYCAEMLSLTGKIAAVYAQHFQERETLSSVNEVESLTAGLSHKIFQKMLILTAHYSEQTIPAAIAT